MSEELNNEVVNEAETVEAPENKPEKTFTQDEVNKLLADRVARANKKLEKFADYDDLQAKLSAFEKAEKERKEAEMTELERYQAQLSEKDGHAQSLTKQLEELQTQMQQEKIVNAFIKAAPGVNIPSDRLDAALKLIDTSAVSIEDGKVVGLEDAMNALVEQYGFLAETKKPQKPIGEPSNSPKDTTDKTNEQLLKEAANKVKRTQTIEAKVAYAALKAKLGL
jgi:hypothetical protein